MINEMVGSDYFKEIQEGLYSKDAAFNKLQLYNIVNHSSEFVDILNLIMTRNVCDMIDEGKIKIENSFHKNICYLKDDLNISEDIFNDGLSLIIAKFNRNISILLKNYKELEKTEFQSLKKNYKKDCPKEFQKDAYVCFFNSSYFKRVFFFKELIFKYQVQIYNDFLFKDILNHFFKSINLKQSIFLICIIGLFLFSYIFLVLRFILNLRHKIKIVTNFVLLIPIETLFESNNVKKYFERELHITI